MYIQTTYPWSSSPGDLSDKVFPTPHCEYLVYLQQHIPSSISVTALQSIEEELRFPTGVIHVPRELNLPIE